MNLLEIYKILSNEFGFQRWWPVISKNPEFEIIIGAILTQQTTWRNVEQAIKNLKLKGLLDPFELAKSKSTEVEELVRPAGFYKQKAKRVVDFSKYLMRKYDGNLNKLFNKPLNEIRKELLNLNGIGLETADSILLYAANKPIFVIDAYTKRLCERLEIKVKLEYEELRKFFESNLPKNLEVYKEFHALIVKLGKNYCKVKPLCDKCSLSKICKFREKNKNPGKIL